MSWLQIVLFIVIAGACIWLIVDTTLYVIKKVKAKKLANKQKEEDKQE